MEFNVRSVKEEDYDGLLKKWWSDWRFTRPPKEFLPMSSGLIVSYEGVDVCACFIYNIDNAPVAWMEFVISNFEVKDRELRKNALEFMYEFVKQVCTINDKKFIFVNAKSQYFQNGLKASGFKEGTDNVKEMIYLL